MRFLHWNTPPRRSEEDLSAASSFQSVDSYELFDSACSDYTDCEYCDDRRRRRARPGNSHRNSPISASASHASHMDPFDVTAQGRSDVIAHAHQPDDIRAVETWPLLNTHNNNNYRTIVNSSDSLGPADLSSKEILSNYQTYHTMEKQNKPERKRQSSLVTIFSVWNTTMGSSLLTMAWGVERAGLVPALMLLVMMGALCLFTAYLLLTLNKYHGGERCEVPALCRTLLGGWAGVVAHGFSMLVLLGANIVYWILITNFLFFTVNYLTDMNSTNSSFTFSNSTISCPSRDGGNGSLIMSGTNGSLIIPDASVSAPSPYWDLHSTVPIYVACLLFPLLNFRRAEFFTKFNSLGTLSVVYLLVFVLVKGSLWGVNLSGALLPDHAGRDAAVLSGMLALSFYIHNIIITIMNNNDHQENNGRDLTIAFVLVTLTYSLVGAVFYICFPLIKSCIEDNMLNNFEMHDVMTAVARMLLLFQVVTVYPLVAFMLRSEAILLLPVSERCKSSAALTVSINTCIVIVCILFACYLPNIGTIIRYTGAVSGLVHIFALPSLLQIRSLQLRGELTLPKTLLYVAIIALGTANLIMQFFISE